MLEHIKGSGGLGAIYPAMANSIVALRCLGYQVDDPLVRKALHEIESLEVYDTVSIGEQRVEALHLQPCHSPIWDTALLMNALIETGMPQDHPSLQKAGAYLVSRQTKTVGDWKFSSPDAEPGGWYFQFENEFYPDVDDSAVVLMALSKIRMAQTTELQESIRRGTNWVLAMQGSDGGWGAYDKDNNRIVFNYIPFADHHALLDPSTSDLAGRCLEMLAALGYDQTHPAVAPALRFLKREQEADGSWYGRWGVNYIYGTWSVLAGLRAIGVDLSEPYIRRAVAWLESKQNPDGGWGESCLSYGDPAWSGKGDSTPSQTAWAIMGLMSAGMTDAFSVARGIQYLAPSPNEGWVVGRGPPHRHRISSGVLSPLPLVLPILSVVGLGHVSESTDAREDAGRRSTAARTRIRVSSSRSLNSPPASSVGAWQPLSGSSVNPIAIFAATRWELQAVRRGLAADRVATIAGVRCHIGQQGESYVLAHPNRRRSRCGPHYCGKGIEGTAHVVGHVHGFCLRARTGSGGRPHRRHSGVFCAW